jgi:hypothetical protein
MANVKSPERNCGCVLKYRVTRRPVKPANVRNHFSLLLFTCLRKSSDSLTGSSQNQDVGLFLRHDMPAREQWSRVEEGREGEDYAHIKPKVLCSKSRMHLKA